MFLGTPKMGAICTPVETTKVKLGTSNYHPSGGNNQTRSPVDGSDPYIRGIRILEQARPVLDCPRERFGPTNAHIQDQVKQPKLS
ncbi:hypothetical protein VTN96DRAFT_5113 [Rasamsonia emersonii]